MQICLHKSIKKSFIGSLKKKAESHLLNYNNTILIN